MPRRCSGGWNEKETIKRSKEDVAKDSRSKSKFSLFHPFSRGSRDREKERQPKCVYSYAREVGGGANKRGPCFVSFGSGFTSAFVRHEAQKGGEDEVYAAEEREENERRDGPRRNRPTVPCYYLRSCGESAFQDPFLPSFLPDALLPPSRLRALPFPRFSLASSSILPEILSAKGNATLRLYFIVIGRMLSAFVLPPPLLPLPPPLLLLHFLSLHSIPHREGLKILQVELEYSLSKIESSSAEKILSRARSTYPSQSPFSPSRLFSRTSSLFTLPCFQLQSL